MTIPPGVSALQAIRESQAHQSSLKGNKMEKLADGWIVSKMAVNKTEGPENARKRTNIGNAHVPIPTIKAFIDIISKAGIAQKDVKPEEDDGVPLYDNDIANWLQSAITAKVYVKARNSLVDGSTELQAGKTLPSNFDELMEPADRVNVAMKVKAECITSLCNFIANAGIPAASVEKWRAMFRSPDALSPQSDSIKAKALGYLEGFSKEQSPENLARYMTTLAAIETAAQSKAEELM
jgi:hypothetical protein